MTVAAIRGKIKMYVDDMGDKKVKALYTFLEEEIEDTNFTLTEDHLRILDEEHALHISGKTKSYSWEEAKQIIRSGAIK